MNECNEIKAVRHFSGFGLFEIAKGCTQHIGNINENGGGWVEMDHRIILLLIC